MVYKTSHSLSPQHRQRIWLQPLNNPHPIPLNLAQPLNLVLSLFLQLPQNLHVLPLRQQHSTRVPHRRRILPIHLQQAPQDDQHRPPPPPQPRKQLRIDVLNGSRVPQDRPAAHDAFGDPGGVVRSGMRHAEHGDARVARGENRPVACVAGGVAAALEGGVAGVEEAQPDGEEEEEEGVGQEEVAGGAGKGSLLRDWRRSGLNGLWIALTEMEEGRFAAYPGQLNRPTPWSPAATSLRVLGVRRT